MKDIKESFEQFNIPTYSDIPDIGLYLDQVVRYVNSSFMDFPEMNVTASMLTNYVKLKIVSKSGKKTYGRNQIAAFIFISMSKTVLSMDNIRVVLANAIDDAEVSYNAFRNSMIKVMKSFSIENEPVVRDGIALSNICIAIGHKMYLDRYFGALNADE